MTHLLVDDADAGWQRRHDGALVTAYVVGLAKPELGSWGMRDCTLTDPSGVLWRIAEAVRKR